MHWATGTSAVFMVDGGEDEYRLRVVPAFGCAHESLKAVMLSDSTVLTIIESRRKYPLLSFVLLLFMIF